MTLLYVTFVFFSSVLKHKIVKIYRIIITCEFFVYIFYVYNVSESWTFFNLDSRISVEMYSIKYLKYKL